ncbi:MAG: DUF362 domain-containing protein [Desulfomonile tiedjei]|uniref:DUF362 domain-containing protein n=1 Tax=Desulfomonile tiedjei TaxID=2358 RepID=A0A9D6Z284_9BACT|nr:DUF362 domain-containing protein [Desulfomonile tiedjei]
MSKAPDRREFLRKGLITTAAVLTTASGALNPAMSFAESPPDLVICHGNDPEAMTRSAVEALGGIKRFVKPGNKVLIKPNMSFASGPGAGSNTHPGIVKEVARLCADAGASKISVVDNVLHSPADCMKLSKIPETCKDIANTTVSYAKNKRLFREVKVDQGKQLKSMEVLADALDADVLIAIPVGKSHSSSGVSLSMKGMMGLIFDRLSFHTRHDLHESIVDMVTVLKPHLVIVDGTRILSTGGPGGPGKVIPLNLIIASTDMVAADAQMVALGTWYDKKFQPQQVRHIRSASERGLGRMDLDKLNIKTLNT